MPLCGFDKQMIEGLEAFHEGLAEQLIEKIKENNFIDEKEVGGHN